MRSSPTFPPTCSRSVAETASEPVAPPLASSSARRWAPFVFAGVAVVVAAALLLSMGRHTWCDCRSVIPWSWDVWSKHNSQHILDPYSFTHVLHGLAFFAGLWVLAGSRLSIAWRCAATAVLESAWEILENSPIVIERYRAATISLDYFGDSVVNSIADVACCLLGFWIASKLPWRVTLAAFFVTEAMLLWWVHDSLLLNILQLVWPLEAVKQWQMSL